MTNGSVYSISGAVSGIRDEDQTGQWAPSAGAVIFTPDKSIMAALRIVGGRSTVDRSYDIVFVRNFGTGMVTERLGKIGLGQKLTFALSWSPDGMITANANGQMHEVAFKPLGEAVVQATCSGGSFAFTDLKFFPAGDDADSGPVKRAAIDRRR
jgi:hypothetical protein